MKKFCWPAWVLAGVFAVGCQDSPEARSANARAKQQIREAAEATGKALQVQKEAYRRRMGEDLGKLDEQIRRWKEKLAGAGQETREKLKPQVEELEKKRDALRDRLKDLPGDSKEAWADVKGGLDRAYDDLKEAFGKARDNFK